MYSVLTIGFGSIYHVYLHQSAIASWPKHGFSMITFQRSFYNENSGGHFSVADSVLRQLSCHSNGVPKTSVIFGESGDEEAPEWRFDSERLL